jgi:prefoldin subunit 5
MNKLEEALKQIENRINALQEKAAYIRQELGIVNEPEVIVDALAIEPPKPRRGRRRTVNAE